MRLIKALRTGYSTRLAFVGAGGKTSALFRLAEEYLEPIPGLDSVRTVILSTTTHLSVSQTLSADHHFTINSIDEFQVLEKQFPSGTVLLTGVHIQEGRVSGLQPGLLDHVQEFAQKHGYPLLIEADGSRQRPLKAPASHEPVVPEWVDIVVVTAGLSALNKPINSQWVHRPDRLTELCGQPQGSEIEIRTFLSVLQSAQGGLKNVPSNARRICLLNQYDTQQIERVNWAKFLELLPTYDAVIFASLDPQSVERVTAPDNDGVISVHELAAGIILAAGGADRMGIPKQVLNYKGVPLVSQIVSCALKSNLSPVIVVTGAYTQPIQQALAGYPVSIVHNPNWCNGMSTSLKAGLLAAQPNIGSAIFLLSDQPFVSPEMLCNLVELHARTLSPIIAPVSDGKRGNPVLFDMQTFPDLMQIEGDVGGRAIFDSYPITELPWDDPNVFLDIDTPDDYQKLLDSSVEFEPNEI